jgi:hypothetical protein
VDQGGDLDGAVGRKGLGETMRLFRVSRFATKKPEKKPEKTF